MQQRQHKPVAYGYIRLRVQLGRTHCLVQPYWQLKNGEQSRTPADNLNYLTEATVNKYANLDQAVDRNPSNDGVDTAGFIQEFDELLTARGSLARSDDLLIQCAENHRLTVTDEGKATVCYRPDDRSRFEQQHERTVSHRVTTAERIGPPMPPVPCGQVLGGGRDGTLYTWANPVAASQG